VIRVLVVDDHIIFRAGLKQVFGDESDLEVAGEAGTAKEALSKAALADRWDVMLLDIALPDKNGLEVLKQVKAINPRLPVLMLSIFPEDQYAIRALSMGAAGYVTKDSEPDQLLGAIRRAAAGRRYVSAGLAEQLASGLDAGAPKLLHQRLSDREYQVFCAIARGLSSSEIAEELSLKVKTVATYRGRILEKMGFAKNAEIIHYAIENRLVHFG
jgi:DNA-binding NarL/FixJ family response regulator